MLYAGSQCSDWQSEADKLHSCIWCLPLAVQCRAHLAALVCVILLAAILALLAFALAGADAVDEARQRQVALLLLLLQPLYGLPQPSVAQMRGSLAQLSRLRCEEAFRFDRLRRVPALQDLSRASGQAWQRAGLIRSICGWVKMHKSLLQGEHTCSGVQCWWSMYSEMRFTMTPFFSATLGLYPSSCAAVLSRGCLKLAAAAAGQRQAPWSSTSCRGPC